MNRKLTLQENIKELIPPNDYDHRHEFSNHSLVDALDDSTREPIENRLIELLYSHPDDILIVETLAYMRSSKSIPALIKALELNTNNLQRIIIASSIFKINQDLSMINTSIDAFNHLRKKWDLVFSFSYLKSFNNKQINDLMIKYVHHSDILISSNAKSALGLDK